MGGDGPRDLATPPSSRQCSPTGRAGATERGPPAHPPARLERQRRTAGRRTSGRASPLLHCWASEPACASLGSGGPRREGEWGRTPEGGGRASSELAGPRGGRRGPGSAGQRGRAAWCPGLAVAAGLATHSQAHAAPAISKQKRRAASSASRTPGLTLPAWTLRSRWSPLVTQVLWEAPRSAEIVICSQAPSDK